MSISSQFSSQDRELTLRPTDPIAMRLVPPVRHKAISNIYSSVRSTNVYEEKSLGIYSPEEDNDTESVIDVTGDRIKVWSRYLGMHARKQLSFGKTFPPNRLSICLRVSTDMWWLGLALFLVCIIEVCAGLPTPCVRWN